MDLQMRPRGGSHLLDTTSDQQPAPTVAQNAMFVDATHGGSCRQRLRINSDTLVTSSCVAAES